MNKKDIMIKFFDIINNRGLLTKFIKTIFNYRELFDYNYIFRMTDINNMVIVDIYDNVTITRFNRYIFNFNEADYLIKDYVEDGVYVKRISVLNMLEDNDNLLKFAYLFNIDDNMVLDYADGFLDNEFVEIIKDIIK